MLEALIRRPIVPSTHPPILVLLHGLGANEQDLMGLSRELDPSLLVVCLRAPLEYGYGGYAWFDVRWEADGVHVDSEQALLSREILLETLRALPGYLGVEPSKTFLGGFSQGAMMSLGIAAIAPEDFTGILLLSGRVLPEFVSGQRPDAFKLLPFLVQHGTQDPVLPVAGAREIRQLLEGEGCPVSYFEYEMAHEISFESLVDMKIWMKQLL